MNVINTTLSPTKAYFGRDRISIPARGIYLNLTDEQVEGAKAHPVTKLHLDVGALVITEASNPELLPVVRHIGALKLPANLKPGEQQLANAKVSAVDSTVETTTADATVTPETKQASAAKVESGKADAAKDKSKRGK